MLIATRYCHLLRRSSVWYLHRNSSLNTTYHISKFSNKPTNLSNHNTTYLPLVFTRFRKYSDIPESSDPKSKLIIRDSYVKRYKEVVTEPGQFIRLSVEGGGCSGFQYEFNLATDVGDDDIILEKDDAQLLVDSISLDLLQGASVEYHEELIRSSFRVVDIPNAESGCSCGASFAIKS
ncbi:Iron-sulfur cluster assembly 2-like protein, mitochondrial [Oopsacas minuta]|uniref:Iron-sulfur cluster assembly 2 homolog, mitochondrial n=1 Tax=Oopsacas minuta TaxID=111878 RepID=A0AAV7JAS7_9METZ|nr:Iron-sulfur cluster assembly 2-like protein, mitochondrial [Oopsacas minuta]